MYQHASMNRIYRLVWNESLNAYVAAAETARGRRKSGKRGVIAAALALTAAVAHAGGPAGGTAGATTGGPTGGQVTGGSGTISQSGSTTTIAQASENLSLNWQSFNIAAQQTVDFVQPNAAAIAVNHILGNSGSVILGHLDANGQVYLINPNGVLFGKGAEVNVGGLVASTLDLDDGTLSDSALNDSALGDASKHFIGTSSASVVNEGSLTAVGGHGGGGGAIVLLGNHVSNTGVISAQLGSVALGAGSAVTLRFAGTHLVSMKVDQSVLNSVASNGGLIRADGGAVLMTAGAQKSLLASVVNNTGIIEARTLDRHEGTITLLGGMTAGTVDVGGTLDASAPNGGGGGSGGGSGSGAGGGNGGSVDTSAAHVEIAAAARITTAAALGLSGSWSIDPTNFTISAGTTAQSASGIGATTLQGALAHGNVSIATSASGSEAGDIDVNAPVSWSANALTLTAANDINVNAVMTVSGSAKVNFEPGSGNLLMGFATDGSFAGRVDISSSAANALTIGGQVYTVINSLGAQGSTTGTDLQGISGNLAGHFALGSNIDASATAAWGPCNGCGYGGNNGFYGFTPIGSSGSSNFSGIFDGLGHTIGNLTVNNGFANNIGLFGWMGAGGIARNVGLVGLSSYAQGTVGALVGMNYGKISNSYSADGNVTAGIIGGGLVGLNGASGIVNNTYTTGSVSSEFKDGGVVATNYGTVTNSHSSAAVGGGSVTGGLVGLNYGTISKDYATGNIDAHYSISAGGLVGTNTITGTITDTYATGTVTSSHENVVGGLVGTNAGAVSNSYASGAVSVGGGNYQGNDAGGLIGSNSGTISTSYATGAVTAPDANQSNTGGLVGYNTGSISASYATGAVGGFNNVGGLVGNNQAAGTIATSSATGNVTASNQDSGGLVGLNYGAVTTTHASGTVSGFAGAGGLIGANGAGNPGGPVADSYASGDVSAAGSAGGLAGFNNAAISGSFATGSVTVTLGDAGGLVGLNQAGSLTRSFATGAVTGGELAGGLVGQNYGAINIAFASGAVNGSTNVGGLVGQNTAAGTITNAYATGSVTGSNNVGGLAGSNYGLVGNTYATGVVNIGTYGGSLVGTNQGTVTNSFYDSAVNPTMTGSTNGSFNNADVPGSIVGLTTAQLQTQANFTSATVANGGANPAWDFGTTWVMYEGHTAPLLQAFMTPLTATGTVIQSYTGAVFAPTVGSLTYSFVPDLSYLFGTVTVVGSAVGAEHVGTYSFTPGGLYSDQLGYILSYNAGSLTITPATLTVSATRVGNKVYDGNTVATLTGGSLVGVLGGNTLTLTQAGSFASKDAGTGIAVTASDSIGGASAGDYVLVEPTGLVGTITPALLTVSGTTVGNKAYDGSTLALLSGGTLVGLIGGDSVSLNQSGLFASADVGTGIPVTATDTLSGASAGDYSIVEPTGLRGSILPAAGTTAGASDLLLAAINARTQIVENFIYPQLFAQPQLIDASSTIYSADATASQAIVINVSMNIGANGTLKIEQGGLRLPGDTIVGQ